MLGPQMGGATADPVGFWEPRGATIKPYVFDATTGPDGMRIELAPSMHGAILKVTFPEFNPFGTDKRICFKMDDNGWDHLDKREDGMGSISGTSTRAGGHPSNFRHHIRAVGDDRIDKVEQVGRNTACFNYPKNQVVATVRLATSFIDQAQATTNWEREVSPSVHSDFESLKAEAREEWRALMGRVHVKDPGGRAMVAAAAAATDNGEHEEHAERHLTVFYTGLYRALTFPRLIQETDASGKEVHYSPYSPRGGVREGPLCTDNGFWDTFRTVYPLLSLLYPDKLGTIIQGWLNAYKEGGWLPGWASPGYRESMVGTYGDVVVSDALVKKVPGFSVQTAWEAVRKDSFQDEPGGHDGVGKAGLRYYDQYNYIPSDVGVSEQVSRSLDFAFADAAVANAAQVLSSSKAGISFSEAQKLDADRKKLRDRSLAVQRNLFDPSSGLMRPKSRGGSFDGGFQANRWGGSFTEGSSWHHSFPPFAVSELASLHGGRDRLLKKLHEMLQTPGTFNVGGYGQEIHEMTEMRAVGMGQYGHNNQPTHHLLYLFALLGEHDSTADNVRKVMDHAYGVDFYAGDEDNGEMGSWFVLSALGLYAAAPGATDEYVLGSPLFRHVAIHLPPLPAVPDLQAEARPARTLHVVALGTGPGKCRVKQVFWNGESVMSNNGGGAAESGGSRPVISDGVVQKGGVLRFVMEGEPVPPLPFDPELGTAASFGGGGGGGGGSGGALALGGGGQASSWEGGGDGGGGGSGGLEAEVALLAAKLRDAEAEVAQKSAELEAFKRSSNALAGSLKEQLDTYSGEADSSQSELAEAKQELASEQLLRKAEAAKLQAALQEQASEMKELEAQIEHLSQQAENAAALGGAPGGLDGGGGGGASTGAAVGAEVAALKLALEVESKEHKRARLLLDLLEDHHTRVGALDRLVVGATEEAGGSSGGATEAVLSSRPVTSFASEETGALGLPTTPATLLELVSYGGMALGAIVCAWAMCGNSGRSESGNSGKEKRRSRRHKDNSHVV